MMIQNPLDFMIKFQAFFWSCSVQNNFYQSRAFFEFRLETFTLIQLIFYHICEL